MSPWYLQVGNLLELRIHGMAVIGLGDCLLKLGFTSWGLLRLWNESQWLGFERRRDLLCCGFALVEGLEMVDSPQVSPLSEFCRKLISMRNSTNSPSIYHPWSALSKMAKPRVLAPGHALDLSLPAWLCSLDPAPPVLRSLAPASCSTFAPAFGPGQQRLHGCC